LPNSFDTVPALAIAAVSPGGVDLALAQAEPGRHRDRSQRRGVVLGDRGAGGDHRGQRGVVLEVGEAGPGPDHGRRGLALGRER
jgi:hypothetical protein